MRNYSYLCSKNKKKRDMEKEEKELLKKALCYYLPFDIKGRMLNNDDELTVYKMEGIKWGYVYVSEQGKTWGYTEERPMENFKPYLRPMLSMTEEEKHYFWCLNHNPNTGCDHINVAPALIDWLLSNHFDYMGLIEKGFALEAREGMY